MTKKTTKKTKPKKTATKKAAKNISSKKSPTRKAPKKKTTTKKTGRPTKYKKEFADELIAFYDGDPYEDVKINHYKKGEISWTDTKRMPAKLPTMVEFARHIGVGLRTCFDWLDSEHSSYQKEFSRAYTRLAKKAQKNFLIQNGLQGLYNPVFAKFVAINISDMIDKKDHNLSNDPENPVKWVVEVVDNADNTNTPET